MKTEIPAGQYVLAVSGGVDSMVLLDLLSNLRGVELTVAHLEHGIRPESIKDEQFVRRAAEKKGLKFVSAHARLGPKASEDTARRARYKFLEKARVETGAKAIVTAHHQDDMIETAFINLLRGTGRRGLVALAANPKVIRPLLQYKKQDVLSYARDHRLIWREDSSNASDDYLRNYIRRHIVPRMSRQERQNLISNHDLVAEINNKINYQIANISQLVIDNELINRRLFTALPVDLGNELVLFWLKQRSSPANTKTVKRLNLALRASKDGTVHQVSSGLNLLVSKKTARFSHSL